MATRLPQPLPKVDSRSRESAIAHSQPNDGLKRLAIVPVFNERGSVSKLLHRLKRSLPEFDLLVIDDGSTDDTLRCIPPGVTVVSLPFNMGIGGAMQTGYRYAALHGYDVAVQVDGDGQHRPSQVRRLVDRLLEGDLDLVVGSRFLESGKYRQGLPRRVGASLLGILLNLLTGQTVTDCTSGFRAANRKVIRAFAHWYPEDYPEPEVILLLHRAGYRLGELSARMRQRREGQSSIGMLVGLFYFLKVTTCLLLDLIRAPWPHAKFGEGGFPKGPAAKVNNDNAGATPPTPHESSDGQEPDSGHTRRRPAIAGGPASAPVQT